MFKKIGKLLGGKKTYMAAGAAVATAVLGYTQGQVTAEAALQLALTGIIGATLRNAIGSLIPAA